MQLIAQEKGALSLAQLYAVSFGVLFAYLHQSLHVPLKFKALFLFMWIRFFYFISTEFVEHLIALLMEEFQPRGQRLKAKIMVDRVSAVRFTS